MAIERSTDLDRPIEQIAGILKRFKKNEVIATNPISLGMIKKTHINAIEYSPIALGSSGLLMFGGFLMVSICWFISWYSYMHNLASGSRGSIDILNVLAVAAFFYVGLYSGIKYTRLELYRPQGEPIIFDRENRKVYRIYREVYSGWRGLLKPWPIKYAEHDWNLVDAEHQAALNANGSGVSRVHALIFLVRKSDDDPTVVASFTLGGGLQMGELTLPAVWEHLRRFMECDGPHLPAEETIEVPSPTGTLVQCLAASGPYGKNFRVWWKNYAFFFILYLLLLPVSLPTMTLIGIFKWLGARTSIPVIWPEHVQNSVRI